MIRMIWEKIMKWGWDYNRDLRSPDENICIDDCSPSIDINGLSFSVMPAQGGTIVQLRKYDDKLQRNTYSTHIIADGQDVAETIGKIVAIELWKA